MALPSLKKLAPSFEALVGNHTENLYWSRSKHVELRVSRQKGKVDVLLVTEEEESSENGYDSENRTVTLLRRIPLPQLAPDAGPN